LTSASLDSSPTRRRPPAPAGAPAAQAQEREPVRERPRQAAEDHGADTLLQRPLDGDRLAAGDEGDTIVRPSSRCGRRSCA